MIRKNKNYLSYYAWFNKIKDADKCTVARISGRTIYSSDDIFLSYIQSGMSEGLYDIKVDRRSYNVVDERTKQIVGYVDNHFNVFNNASCYSGTIHNISRILSYVTKITVTVIIIFLILIILFLKTTGDSIKPKDIYISEADGMSVEDQWNIFGQTEQEKTIMPGKKGVYYFTIHNENNFDIVCDLDFSEVNDWDIALRYRLRKDAFTYLKGSSKIYLEVDEIDTENIVVPAKSYVTLALDWYWDENISDIKDTLAGMDENSKYTLVVVINSEEKTK